MSGHSKWATIKRKKALIDAKRGSAFTKVIRELTVAARIGGADPGGNPRLRVAIDKAKAASMPSDNMNRAIARGAGTLDGVNYEEMTYEGYGPSGVAMVIESVTDNKDRTTGEIRHLLSKYGGNLGVSGAVSWNFERKGLITAARGKLTEDGATELALEIGADDVHVGDEHLEFITQPADFEAAQSALKAKKIAIEEAKLALIPKNRVAISGDKAESHLKLLDALDENDDIQNVFDNADVDEDSLPKS